MLENKFKKVYQPALIQVVFQQSNVFLMTSTGLGEDSVTGVSDVWHNDFKDW